MEILKSLFLSKFGHNADSVTFVRAHASARSIWRLKSSTCSAIGVINSDRLENRAFINFSKHFRAIGLPVPEIYCEDDSQGAYLQEDLGDVALYDLVSKAEKDGKPFNKEIREWYENVVRMLPRFQIEAGRTLDFNLCYPSKEYGLDSILWDMHYFRDSFLKRTAIPFDSASLENDFARLASFLDSAPREYFLYRDFQARNIMVRDGKLYFIDYDRGRKGSLCYDLATLLYQSKVSMPVEARAKLIELYLESASKIAPIDRAQFEKFFPGFVLMQFLHRFGAYGKLGLGQGKAYFTESIPKAAEKLSELLPTLKIPVELPVLRSVLETVCKIARGGQEAEKLLRPASALEVKVMSFSYRNGIPQNSLKDGTSLSGGGFVFDCRCIQNPGREERFKHQTGIDPEVIAYLNRVPQSKEFLGHVFGLIDGAVKNYLERGLVELVVSFGCTGGQHRSVYFAEALRTHLVEKFPVRVVLSHRDMPVGASHA